MTLEAKTTTAETAEAPFELIKLLELSDRREPVVIDIVVWVALAIINGQLLPGQDLNSVELATRFGSSRTPVREALALLESNGLIEMRARKRPRVASFGPEQSREVFFVRAELISVLTRAAIENATDEDIGALDRHVEVLRELAAARDDDRYRWAHFAFFDDLVAMSGNVTARAILNSLFLRTLPVRRALSLPHRLDESLYYAELILAAAHRRDAEMAALLVRRSVQAAVDVIAPEENLSVLFLERSARCPVERNSGTET